MGVKGLLNTEQNENNANSSWSAPWMTGTGYGALSPTISTTTTNGQTAIYPEVGLKD